MTSTSSASSSSASSGSSSVASSPSSASTEALTSADPSRSAEEEAQLVQEKIANDLETWQEKFTKAADKGAEDLSERIQNITERQIRSQVHSVGDAFVVQLEESCSSETASLKKAIQKVVQSMSEDPSDEDIEQGEAEVVKSVRAAGLAIKNNAQALRTWKQNFMKETQSLVSAASASTLKVLDSIRDLGLQEIGMRWAWMDGVTYKDWAKYHDMEKSFGKWRDEVAAVAQKHEGLLQLKQAAENVEAKGMALAEDAAQELTRLKEVGIWKIKAVDDSDDFSTRVLPAKAALASKKAVKVANSAGGSLADSLHDTAGSIASEATQKAENVPSAGSSVVIGTEPGMVEQATSSLSETIIGTPESVYEKIVAAAGEKVEEASKLISDKVIGSSTPISESVASSASSAASMASEKLDKAAHEASDAVIGSSTPLHESIASDASEGVESAASAASRKLFAGAMAQKVKVRVPIFDDDDDDDDDDDEDDETYTEQVQKVMNRAGDRYAEIKKAVNEAMNPTPTQGSIESVTSLVDEQYSSALSAASRALYGTEAGTGEKAAKAVSSRYANAVAA